MYDNRPAACGATDRRLAPFLAVPLLALIISGCASPSAVVSPAWRRSPPRRVAVAEVVDTNPRQTRIIFYLAGGTGTDFLLADRVAAYMEQELLRAGFSVIERKRVAKILEELNLQASDLVDPKHAKEFGRIAGVDAIVFGESHSLETGLYIIPFLSGQEYTGSAKVVDVETGEVLATLLLDKGFVAPLIFGLMPRNTIRNSVREAIGQLPRPQ